MTTQYLAQLYGGPHDGMERRVETVTQHIDIPTPYSVNAYRYELDEETPQNEERPRYNYAGKFNRFTGVKVE